MMDVCEWFALCTNAATKTRPHPILGDVPICDRCDEKMDRIAGPSYGSDEPDELTRADADDAIRLHVRKENEDFEAARRRNGEGS